MKEYIRNIFDKNFKFKVFNKLLILYSAVVVVSLVALTFFMCNSIITSTRNSEINKNKKIVNSVNIFLSNKNINAANMIYQLYSSQELLNDLTSYLQYNIEDYTSRLLDRYSESASFNINTIETFIRYNFNTYPDVESITLYSSVQNMFSTYNANNKFSFYSGNSTYNQNIVNDNTMIGPSYTPSIIKDAETSSSPYTITHIIKNSETKRVLGNISINYSPEKIKNSYSQYKDELLGYILILSPNGNVIYDSSKKHTGIYPYLSLLKSDVTSVNLETKSYVNIDSTNPNAIIVGIIPENEVLNKSISQVKTVISIALILILIAIFFIFFFLASYSKRTENIMKAMNQLKNGDLTATIPIISKQDDELSVISQSFNDMCENLNSYIKKVYLLELKQKNAELVALQAQINPHFLYNTLESIRMRAIAQDSPDVAKMIYILATFFRNSVKRKMIISVSEELNNCKLYLELFKIRYESKLNFSLDVAEEVKNYGILKLSVQPIIENYIIHGIDFTKSDNFACINASLNDNKITITVSDNGKGINNENLRKIQNSIKNHMNSSSDSIGIINVNERIKLTYGEEYGIEIDSIEGVGTNVHIKIPAINVAHVLNN